MCEGLDENFVDPPKISQKVVSGMYPGITTVQLDNLAAEIAVDMTGIHPDYAVLAARISVSNLQKETHDKFSDVMQELYNNKHPKTGVPNPLISKEFLGMVLKHADKINAALDYQRDFDFNYFGFKTLEQSYLMKIGEKVVERPQHMMMRVALAIHGEDFESAFKAYDYTSRKLYTHAGTTLLNAGTLNGQLSSFFQVQMKEDSIEGIYDTVATCARISKASGSVGMSFQKIRASGSYIAGTNGTSNGIIPMLRVFNDAARFITPGARKVKGTYAVYLEPWHADIFEFIDLSKNSGEENLRARHLLLGLWIPDIFMKRKYILWDTVCVCLGIDCHAVLQVLRRMESGPWCVPTSVLVLIPPMARSLKNFTLVMKRLERLERLSLLKSCGSPSWMLKLRAVCLSCAIRVSWIIANAKG